MRKSLVIIVLLYISGMVYGQNLVLNPSFESVTEANLQCGWYTSQAQFADAMDNWTAPTGGSTDIFSLTLAQSCYCHPHSTHTSAVGTQDPRTGDVMSHVTVYGDGGCDPYREYLQGELSTPLVVGNTYEVEFYVSFGDYCTDATNNLGVYFTTTPVNDGSMCVYDVDPHLNYTTVVTEEDGWYQILFTFTPTQPYEYFMIGNFYTDVETSTIPMGGTKATVRYFVDDVRIEEENVIPTSDFTLTTPVCEGESSTITYTGNAESSATYHWDFDGGNASPGTGQGSHDVYWMDDGDYTISLWVEENGQSSDTTTHTVTVNPIPTPYFTLGGLDCYGDNVTATYTGSASSSASYNWNFDGATVLSGSGQGPYTLAWSTTGTHTVTLDVTENGCTSLPNSETVVNPPELTVDLISQDISCFGMNDGAITSSVSGGTTPYNYLWSESSTTAGISGLSQASYILTVTDDHGCTISDTAQIDEPDELLLFAGTDQNICYGDTAVLSIGLTGGVSPFTYYYDDGSGAQTSSTADIDVSPDTNADYSVFAEDNNGCLSDTANIAVQVSSPMSVNTSLQNVSCNGECDGETELTVSGGIAPYTYSWSSETNIQTGLCAGDYDVTITDDLACTREISFTITEPDVLSVNLDAEDASCFGLTDGSISSSVSGGIPPYDYAWSNSENSADIADLSPGNYSLTVTDDHACTAEALAIIAEPTEVQLYVSDDLFLCAGDPANMTASASGGNGPYIYYWDTGNGFTAGNSSQTEYPYSSRDYAVYAEDDNGCVSDTAYISVSLSSVMHMDLQVNDISCHSMCDGSAEINITGGISPFEYSWESNGNTISGLCEDNYQVSITDQNDCVVDTSFYIAEPDTLMGTIFGTDPLCPGSSDGTAFVDMSGGIPPYEYQWSEGQQDDTAVNLSAGLHSLTVTDANNCQTALQIYLDEPDNIIINGLYGSQICINGSANLNASITGGTAPYYYQWTGTDSSVWNGTEFTVSPDETEDYSLMITDANGCTKEQTVTVSVYPEIEILNLYTNDDSVCRGESTKLNFEVAGGNGGPFEVMLNDNQIITSPHAISPQHSGWYEIQVSDACETPSVKDSVYIEVLDLPANNFVSDIVAKCPPAKISFHELNEQEGYIYEWTFGDGDFAYGAQTSHVYENSGWYDVSLLVTDVFGCSKRNNREDMIHIYPVPDIDFYTRPNDVSMLNPEVEFRPVTAHTDSLYWYFGDGDSTLSSRWNPVHMYEDIGRFTVRVIGVNNYGCRDTARKVLKVKEHFTFYAPTAFTPNYDGKNDCFSVCGEGIDPMEFSLSVYNRWGEVVFETDRYDKGTGCNGCGSTTWDGTAQGNLMKGDELLPAGAYSWVCVYKDIFGVEHKEEGVVKLIR